MSPGHAGPENFSRSTVPRVDNQKCHCRRSPDGSITYADALLPPGVRGSCSGWLVMARVEARRACRHSVKWPARVRSIADPEWHPAQVRNLSVTGVLIQTERAYELGERVEVEIDFLTHPGFKTVVSGVGYVVRADCEMQCAAIHFDLGCTPTVRPISPPSGRAARP
jgi:hypothetical protein